MYDRDYKVIVDNIPKKAITFTNEGFSQKEMLATAEKLAILMMALYAVIMARNRLPL